MGIKEKYLGPCILRPRKRRKKPQKYGVRKEKMFWGLEF